MEREALVVGINRYPFPIDASNQQRDLRTSARDAEAIAQRLETYGNFRVRRLPETPDKATVPEDGQVKLPELKAAIEDLFMPKSRNLPDAALLFFAGHGLRHQSAGERPETYLVTSDIYYDPHHPDLPKGLPLSWLRDLLQASPIRQQIVWLDCCHSGELFNFDEAALKELGQGQDRCLIAASQETQQAYEAFGGDHGLLSGALIEGLDPTQQPKGYVTNHALVTFVRGQLQTAPQRPRAFNYGGEIILTGTKEKIDPLLLQQMSCPYKGLESFDFKDAAVFYGRTQLVAELLEKLRERNFLAVLGASGSGKSSVVKAGLLPAWLQQQQQAGLEPWAYRLMRPGEAPLKSLARAFADGTGSLTLAAAEALAQQGAAGLVELVQQSGVPGMVLMVDQFEEVFTLCPKESERQRFFETLLGALEATTALKVVVTMRADFYGKCLEHGYTPLVQQVRDHVPVTQMTSEELREVIVQPAQALGVEVQPELVEQMLEDVKGPGSLPLLEYALRELWDQREVNRLTVAEYSRIGKVEGALEQRAEAIYNEDLIADATGEALASVAEQQTAQRIFLELTRLGEGTEDTRRQVLKEELLGVAPQPERMETVLKKLTDARLVVTSELTSRGGEAATVTAVDVAHEALIRNWERLRKWIKDNREVLKQKRQIEADAQLWESRGKRRDLLLQGLKLEEAITFQEQFGQIVSLLDPGQEFVEKSARKQRVGNQQRWGIGVAVVLGLGVLSSAAFWQAGNADAQRKVAQEAAEQAREAAEQAREAQEQTEVAFNSAEEQRLRANEKASEAREESRKARQAEQDARQQTLLAEQRADETLEQKRLADEQRSIAERKEQEADSNALLAEEKALESVQQSIYAALNSSQAFREARNSLNSLLSGITAINLITKEKLLKTDLELIAKINMQSAFFDYEDCSFYFYEDCFREQNRFWGNIDEPETIIFSPDGNKVAAAGTLGQIVVWETDGTVLTNITAPRNEYRWYYSLAFSPDNSIVAGGSSDGVVRLWDVNGNLLTVFQEHFKRKGLWGVEALTFSPDGQYIASASMDEILLWDRRGNLLKTLEGHDGWVFSISVSPDGSLILSAGNDGIKLWNRDGQLLKSFEEVERNHESSEDSFNYILPEAKFSPDGKSFAYKVTDFRDRDNKVSFVRVRNISGEVLSEFYADDFQDWNGSPIYFSPAKEVLGSNIQGAIESDFVIALINQPARSIELRDIEGKLIQSLKGHDDYPDDLAFSPEGNSIVSTSSDGDIKLWSKGNSSLKTFVGHTKGIVSLSISPNGNFIASASLDGTVKLWDKHGNIVKTLDKHTDEVNSVTFSPDGNFIASASLDGTVKLWDKDGILKKSIDTGLVNVQSVSFSPDSKLIVSTGSGGAKIWNIQGVPFSTLEDEETPHVYYRDAKFSPDGRIVATGSGDGRIKIWSPSGDLLKKSQVAHLNRQGFAEVRSLNFSPDGTSIISHGANLGLNIWDLNGELVNTIKSHRYLSNPVFSPQTGMIYAGSAGDGIKVWTKDGTYLGDIGTSSHSLSLSNITFSSDGNIFVAQLGDRIIVFDNSLASLTLNACSWLDDYLNSNPNVIRNELSTCNFSSENSIENHLVFNRFSSSPLMNFLSNFRFAWNLSSTRSAKRSESL